MQDQVSDARNDIPKPTSLTNSLFPVTFTPLLTHKKAHSFR